MIRIGHGFDVHRFAEPAGQSSIVLGGVTIPHERSLLAHSDGDVVLHALSDALLGAIAAGDIGQHFPDTDPEFSGIDSRKLLANVYQLVLQKGYKVGNVDLTIVAQQPKMSPHIPLMREHIADDLQVDVSAVNVKATTTEGLGYAGREEGIAVHAVCTVIRND